MMKENARNLMAKLEFPSDAQIELLNTLDVLLETDEFANIVKRYEDENCNIAEMVEDTKNLAEAKEICVFTAHMLLFLCMCPVLKNRYAAKGIDEDIYYDTVRDLRYKLIECSLVHGKYGTMTTQWYERIFEMQIFALGRLQFEIIDTWFECDVKGRHIPKGTKVLSIHIPRTGTPLRHDLVVESYNKAKVFFDEEYNSDIIFICYSWLIYPWNRTVYKEGSNLAQFYDDFTIVGSSDLKDYYAVWRLFDCLFDGNPDHLPADTSLRRAFIERIKSGEPIGLGTGVILCDK